MSVHTCARFQACRLEAEHGRLLEILRRNPDMPFSIDRLAAMLGRTHAQIQYAIEDLEGPVAADTPGAFVHFWRLTDEAVYLP